VKGMQGEIVRYRNTDTNAISDVPLLESRTSVSTGDLDGEEN